MAKLFAAFGSNASISLFGSGAPSHLLVSEPLDEKIVAAVPPDPSLD